MTVDASRGFEGRVGEGIEKRGRKTGCQKRKNGRSSNSSLKFKGLRIIQNRGTGRRKKKVRAIFQA